MFNIDPYSRRGPRFSYQQARQPFGPFSRGQVPDNGQFPQFSRFDQASQQYPRLAQVQQSLQSLSQPRFDQFQQPPLFPPTPIGSPPPQYSQRNQPQPQQPVQGLQSTTEAYVLTRTTLPVAAGESVPPQYPNYEQLVPTKFQHNGLPVYSSVQNMPQPLSRQPSRHNSPAQVLNPVPFIPRRVPVSQQPSRANSPIPVLDPAAPFGVMVPQANIVQGQRRPEVIFHMLRHAHAGPGSTFQAQHTEEQYQDIGDPGLSSLGAEQCRNLRAALGNNNALYVLCSPMRRAMVTAGYIFPDWDRRKSNFIAWDKLRDCPPPGNRYQFTRKAGEKREKLLEYQRTVLNYKPFDLRLVGSDWHKDFGQMNSQGTRAEAVRADLSRFKDVAIDGGEWNGVQLEPHRGGGNIHVVILSHNNFLGFLSHQDTLPESSYGSFGFLQCRSYTFASPFIGIDGIEGHSFNETAESQARMHPKNWRPLDERDWENTENHRRISQGCTMQ